MPSLQHSHHRDLGLCHGNHLYKSQPIHGHITQHTSGSINILTNVILLCNMKTINRNLIVTLECLDWEKRNGQMSSYLRFPIFPFLDVSNV